MTAETRRFTVHPAIIFSVIEKQAGTLGKAILELVMNSVDAGATRAEIVLDGRRFSVSDDGKGFSSIGEIKDFFETFGTPHEDGDATFGRFRIGRGQIMAFATNVWRTGEFLMDVDIKGRGLDYRLRTGLPEQKGCVIEGKLYDKVLPSDLDRALKDLRDLAAYVQIPVTLNGKRVNRTPAEHKWDLETDDAYFAFRAQGPLRVYNLGVLVRDYPPSDFGVSGVVVSKRPLDVNFARNDVLVAQCKVWKRIRKALKGRVRKTVSRKARLTDAERQNVVTSMLCGDADYDEIVRDNVRVISDIQGRLYSVREWIDMRVTNLLDPPEDPGRQVVAERAHMVKLVHVVSRKTLDMFDVPDVNSFLAVLRRILGGEENRWKRDALKRFKVVPYEHVTKSIKEGFSYIRDTAKELDVHEQCVLTAIRTYDRQIRHAVARRIPECDRDREIRVGVSDAYHGWTDGKAYVCINRAFLAKAKKGFPGFNAIAQLLVHEYMHGDPDTEAHQHDFDFYRGFHDVCMDDDYGVSYYAEKMMHSYVKELRKRGKAPGHYVSGSQDLAAKAGGGNLGDEPPALPPPEERTPERAPRRPGPTAVPPEQGVLFPPPAEPRDRTARTRATATAKGRPADERPRAAAAK